MLSRLNVGNLPNDGVKIVYLNPSGNVTVRSPQDSQTKTLIKNIAAEKWREISINANLKNEEIVPELKNGINKVISREFNGYLKSGSMLEARNPAENLLSSLASLYVRRWWTLSGRLNREWSRCEFPPQAGGGGGTP